MFWKQMTLKIFIYTVKASLCYSFFMLKWAKVIITLIENFYYKKLPKAKLTSFVSFSAKIRTTSINKYWTFYVF